MARIRPKIAEIKAAGFEVTAKRTITEHIR
ncbi:hypothetical protein HDG38_005019 [Paraburkholderia sp. WSM4177]|nr:hypothetical protein [Paraburkholderia sp. WSM4177]MBB5487034.1 hypothetical protein [Paraburkholderia sp. WSM4180]